MANTFQLLFLYCVLLTTAAMSASPSPYPTVIPAAPPTDGGTCCLQQVSNILDALLGSSDFGNWASVLPAFNPSTLSISGTLFVPAGNDAAVSVLPMDPPSLLYHMVPQRLAFSQLKLFRTGSRLPTFLPNNSILITGGSPSNFTLDGIPLIEPDLFSSDGLIVHGVAGFLNYTVYGGGSAAHGLSPPLLQDATGDTPTAAAFLPLQEATGQRMSHAACSTEGMAVVVASVLGLVILGSKL
ncbi:FAS1 domain-containing protein SELMODRAFT_448915-like [Eucalyptus grandis]|uniref:FAS1 domain-containing protein n=1 Tax=Eucalyptus globulus TaxID=34317 RepID=A0ABD3KTF5_EUCGL|nr:FAS1 domain-containing protein SELMODRAFT_448915-like [Eucalyptus grandis]